MSLERLKMIAFFNTLKVNHLCLVIQGRLENTLYFLVVACRHIRQNKKKANNPQAVVSFLFILTCLARKVYTLKQLPPTNSRQMEFLGRSSAFMPTKYSRNFKRRLASRYSGVSFGILNRSGSAYCLIIDSS